jgi:pimeloyl-ACP methyl ester carboxylesterase
MTLTEQLAAFPQLVAETPLGRVSYRRAGSGAPLVLLHGIGSGAGSWLRQLQGLSGGYTVLAWNAPGYGDSAHLPQEAPAAADYAARVWAWLDALGIERVHLVGHSLGALMAGAAARLAPARVARLTLLAPAGGYGKAEPEVRAAKLRDRLANLEALGPAGMAEKRGAAMLSPQAAADEVAFIKGVMAQVDPAGYAQAARMLCNGDLAADLAALSCPVVVASGSLDGITPPTACRAVAAAARTALLDFGPVGHACPLEAAAAVNHLLDQGTLP